MTLPQRLDADTPPHGDFARYVERLTQQAALPQAQPPQGLSALPQAARGGQDPQSGPSGQVANRLLEELHPELAARVPGAVRMLRTALLVLAALLLVLWWLTRWVPVVLPVALVAAWWWLGSLRLGTGTVASRKPVVSTSLRPARRPGRSSS